MQGHLLRRAVCGARGALLERPGPLAGLATVWEQASHDVAAFLHRPPAAPAALAGARPFTAAAAVCSSSEPQPVEAEAEPAAAPASTRRPQQLERGAATRNCWQCGAGLGGGDMFFCPSCSSIQPPDNDAEAKYYDAFGLPHGAFDLDAAELEQRYKGLQRRLHPDKFSSHSALEKEYADQQAALVNQAYDVLKKPLRRAHYILQQQGLGACEGLTITDPELLMYVMEAREEVEGTHDQGRLQQLLEESRAQEERCKGELADAFRRGDLSHAAEVTTQLRYVKRIQEAIIDKL